MKKHFFIYAFATLLMGGFVASCSDDDPEIPEKPETEKPKPEKPEPEKPKPEPEPVVCPIQNGSIFMDATGLSLKYSGAQLIGKQVKFVANESDATKATLELSAAAGATSKAFEALFTGNSGVIPGEKITSVDIALKIDGDKVTFEGKSDVNGRIIVCTGSGTKDALSVDLQVTMPKNELTDSKFGLQVYKKGKTAPIVLNWNSEAKVPIFDFPVQELLKMVAGMKFPMEGTTETLNISEMLAGVLNSIAFLPDGNIQASYKDKPIGGDWKESPLNLATYKVNTEEKIVTVYINLPQILAFVKSQTKSRAETKGIASDILIAQMVQKALGLVNSILTEGIPVSYKVVDGVTTFYLDEKTLLPILQMIKPLLENEEIVKMLVDMIVKQVSAINPDLAAQLPILVTPIIKGVPAIIDQTKSMCFGLNLIPAVAEK